MKQLEVTTVVKEYCNHEHFHAFCVGKVGYWNDARWLKIICMGEAIASNWCMLRGETMI